MTRPKKETDKLAPFKFLGFEFGSSADGINYPAMCPFSEKDKKMYVNAEDGRWNSFTGQESGNITTFLRKFYKLCLDNTAIKELMPVVSNRKLPIQAIKDKLAYNHYTGTYLIPSLNYEGEVINLTSWSPTNKKPMKIPGIPLGMLNLHRIKDNNKPIYLCEGEFDTIAMEWLLKVTGTEGAAVGVPGANIFKDAWIGFFQNREVIVCYDFDKAGWDGQQKIADKIRSEAKRLRFLLWPEMTKPKYDVRGLIIEHGAYPDYPTAKLKDVMERIEACLHSQTQYERDSGEKGADAPPEEEDFEIPTYEEVEAVFKKYYDIKDITEIACMFAACLANKLGGDPVWMLLVAPPGGSKTEFLMALNKSPFIETVSSLTPAAMIPAARVPPGKPDGALLKKLDGRILVAKDLTTIMTGIPVVRDEVMGLLREAYDGYVEKYFATHKKSYESHFGFLGGITPAIDAYSGVMATMGARFIFRRLSSNLTQEEEAARIRQAMFNINKEKDMRSEIQDIAYRFLQQKALEKLPSMTDDIANKIAAMAMFTSALRASLIKDNYSGEQKAPSFKEVGTRLGKVYAKQAYGFCQYYRKTEVDEEVLSQIRIIAIDSCPAIVVNIIMKMWQDCQDSDNNQAETMGMDVYLGVGNTTIHRHVTDLLLMNVIERVTGTPGMKCFYRLSSEIENLVKIGQIFKVNPRPKFYFAGKGKGDGSKAVSS